VREFDAGYGDTDELLAFLAEEFASREELAQVVADLPLDDLAETLAILVDFQVHQHTCGNNRVPSSNYRAA
jgi:hypothetical protein